MISHWPVVQALDILENRSKAEAAAWTRKYLMDASTARGWWDFEMRGIIASVLISNPVHAITQWLLEMVIVEPVIRLSVQISLAWGFISKGRG